jgi:hypothetical protein
MDQGIQTLILLDIACSRSATTRANPSDVERLFDEFSLPRPKNISNAFQSLERKELAARTKEKGAGWRPNPARGLHDFIGILQN